MRGETALKAEVVFGFDQPAAEELLPLAVDRDASGQRVLRAREPLREVEPRQSWRAGGVSPLLRDERGGEGRLHLLAFPQEVATNLHKSLSWCGPFAHGERGRHLAAKTFDLVADDGDVLAAPAVLLEPELHLVQLCDRLFQVRRAADGPRRLVARIEERV